MRNQEDRMIVVRRIRPRPNARRQSDIETLFQAYMAGGGVAERNNRRVWRPPFEMYETSDALEVVVEVAGLNGEDIEITLEGDVLTIAGSRLDVSTCSHRSYHAARIGYGDFAVELALPFAVEAEEAAAQYDNGFLRVTLPRGRGRSIIPTRNVRTSQEG